jgi:MATE family multidrug resistance protein
MPAYRQLQTIALPIILANLATPLVGFVDVAVIGQLGRVHLLGGLALATMVFSFLFWGFGFLRMGTTALVANALGGNNPDLARQTLIRAITLALLIGSTLLLIQSPIAAVIWSLTSGSSAVEGAAQTYFEVRIWGAPLNLIFICLTGYLLGAGRSGAVLILQLLLNISNILLDLLFVLIWNKGVAGVAEATVWAEGIAVAGGLVLIRAELKNLSLSFLRTALIAPKQWVALLAINRDIMIRTLCLIFAFAWFTNQGAAISDDVLAANLVLMQFVSFAAFFIDGYANAAEVLIGQARGARNRGQTRSIIRASLATGWATGAAITLLFILVIPWVVPWLSDSPSVVSAALNFYGYAAIAPLMSSSAYLLDGLFIGALSSQIMRNAMIQSLLLYLLFWWLLGPLGNSGLWLSLLIFYVARGLTLWRHRSALQVLTA